MSLDETTNYSEKIPQHKNGINLRYTAEEYFKMSAFSFDARRKLFAKA